MALNSVLLKVSPDYQGTLHIVYGITLPRLFQVLVKGIGELSLTHACLLLFVGVLKAIKQFKEL